MFEVSLSPKQFHLILALPFAMKGFWDTFSSLIGLSFPQKTIQETLSYFSPIHCYVISDLQLLTGRVVQKPSTICQKTISLSCPTYLLHSLTLSYSEKLLSFRENANCSLLKKIRRILFLIVCFKSRI